MNYEPTQFFYKQTVGCVSYDIIVQWRNGVLEYINTSKIKDTVRIFRPSQSEWKIFWQILDILKVWEWSAKYDFSYDPPEFFFSNRDVNELISNGFLPEWSRNIDGGCWELSIVYGTKYVSSKGEDVHPRGYTVFQDAVDRLIEEASGIIPSVKDIETLLTEAQEWSNTFEAAEKRRLERVEIIRKIKEVRNVKWKNSEEQRKIAKKKAEAAINEASLLLTDLRKAVTENNLQAIESIAAKLDNNDSISNYFLNNRLSVKRQCKLLKWRVENKSMKEAEAILLQFNKALNSMVKSFHELHEKKVTE